MDEILRSLKISELQREWVETTWQSTLKDVFLPPEIEPPTVKKLQKLADFLKVSKLKFWIQAFVKELLTPLFIGVKA